jgi:hypothetical protein
MYIYLLIVRCVLSKQVVSKERLMSYSETGLLNRTLKKWYSTYMYVQVYKLNFQKCLNKGNLCKLYKPSTWTQHLVPRRFSLDRFNCIMNEELLLRNDKAIQDRLHHPYNISLRTMIYKSKRFSQTVSL